MSEKTTNTIAFVLLGLMFINAFASYQGDSLTMDELSHIPAGYSYLSQRDFRINPEHPPLIKDLAAAPLLFMDINFPYQSDAWQKDVNGQWLFGWNLLFNSNNDADTMIFWARLPMVFILIFLGWFIFNWAKKEFGDKIALLTLLFFTFSPTLLAHGKLVTTDVGATLGIIMATYFWLKFLKDPSKKNVILAGLVFGFAMLLKFSVVLIIPFFAIITIVYALLEKKSLFKYLSLSVLIGIIGVVFVILPVYLFHTSNYPVERQMSDTKDILASSPMKGLKDLCIWMADKPILRALGHYLLGLLMATQRTAFGNTVYFMGNVSASGWWYYFPVVYILKEPLAFHILTLIALLSFAFFMKKPFYKDTISRLKQWVLQNFTLFSMLLFLIIYWTTSVIGNLNIGIRHVIPIFPFTFVLVSIGIVALIENIEKTNLKRNAVIVLFLFFAWYILSSVSSFPYYISYFNELRGGTDNGYKNVVDSNYDWGQDLKRLAEWVTANNIDKIKVDYFGGADVTYYLKGKAERLDPEKQHKGWLAISVNQLQRGKGDPAPGFNDSVYYYKWLDNYQPVARAGKSILIYHIE